MKEILRLKRQQTNTLKTNTSKPKHTAVKLQRIKKKRKKILKAIIGGKGMLTTKM